MSKKTKPAPKKRKISGEEYARKEMKATVDKQLRDIVTVVQRERRKRKRIDPPAFEEAFGDFPAQPEREVVRAEGTLAGFTPLAPIDEQTREWFREEPLIHRRAEEIIKAKAEFAGRPGTWRKPSLWSRFLTFISGN